MSKLTIKELEAFSALCIGQTVRDDGGLWGRVRTNKKVKSGVSITFWYRFKWEGKTKDVACGTWPHDSMPEIRKRRDAARDLVSTGVNPCDQRKVNRKENQDEIARKLAEMARLSAENLTVDDMFKSWLADGVQRKDGNVELRRSFNANVLPHIGNKLVKAVDEHDLRFVLRKLVARGVNRTAVITQNDLTQMFAWAEKRQPWRKLLADGNPTNLIEIEKIVSPDFDLDNTRDRILSIDEIRELKNRIQQLRDEYSSAKNRRSASQPVEETTVISFWLMLSTMCRVGELSMARWEHVDFDAREWFIPKENVKGGVSSLKVYLSDFALAQFLQLYQLTKDSDWCFPATNKDGHVCVKSISKQVGDRQVMFKKDQAGNPRTPMQHRSLNANCLVLSVGKNGAWTPHDLRRTGATMMQSLGVSLEIIDRCQNHVLAGSKVRRHYMHHDYAVEKRDAWRLLGERLSLILNPPANVSLIKNA